MKGSRMRAVSVVLTRVLLAGCFGAMVAGCISQSPPPQVHYYTPVQRFGADVPSKSARPSSAGAIRPLKLGTVTAAPALREPLIWRTSDVEIAFDESHRWAAAPAKLLEEALHGRLFITGDFTPSADRKTPRIDVHLQLLEGTLATGETAATDQALAVATVELTLPGVRPIRRTQRLHQTQPLAAREPEALARALGTALDELSMEIATWVGQHPPR